MIAEQASVTSEDVVRAAERLRGLVKRTPVLSSRLFNNRAGTEALFKCENLQRGGSFKLRGALNFVLQLSEEQRGRGVVTLSSGNHAQAVAIAARHVGIPATIVMPTDAPRAKVDSTQAYGPRIVFFDRRKDDRDEVSARVAKETGAVMVPAFDHPWIVAGQGTATLELLQEHPEIGAVAVPLGGGGLFSGALTVVRALRPELPVYGVEPELADDWYQSLQQGLRVRINAPETIADGLRTPQPGVVTYATVQQLDGTVLTVTEAEIRESVRFLLSRMKLLTEPSGAVAAAAVLSRKITATAGPVGIILSGGNVDLPVLANICSEGAAPDA